MHIEITWSKEDLESIVKQCFSIKECLDLLNGGCYKSFHKYVKLYNIDTSHFTGTTTYSTGLRDYRINNPIEYFAQHSKLSRSKLKQYVLESKLIPYECEICKIKEWKNKKLTLQLDHINGINNDHNLSNLRFLCVNCHSQTLTYCGGNTKIARDNRKRCEELGVPYVKRDIGNMIENRSSIFSHTYTKTCSKCNENLIGIKSSICRKCSTNNLVELKPNKDQFKIDWPSYGELKDLVNRTNYSQAGKILGVSDNAIRKHLKRYEENMK